MQLIHSHCCYGKFNSFFTWRGTSGNFKSFVNFLVILPQGCGKKFYQPGNHKLQGGSWLKKFLSHEAARNFFKPLLGGVWGHAPLEIFEK